VTARRLALFALAALFALSAFGAAASAQQAQPVQPRPGVQVGAPVPTAPAAAPADAPARSEHYRAKALFFWFFALLTVGGCIFVISRRNLVAAVMGLVGTFFAIAAIYLLLWAHFLAAIQVLVYAGAIMVLFVFVVMILNREEDEPWALQGLFGKGVAAISLVYLFARVGQVLWHVKTTAPAALEPVGAAGHVWGSTRALGDTLFHGYLFPFEAVSILLLIAVVGALAVARPKELAEHQESQS